MNIALPRMKESKRYWKHFSERGCLYFEWIIRFAFALELQVGGVEGELFTLRVGLGFLTFYISLENWIWARKLHFPYPDTRNTGFYLTMENGRVRGDYQLHVEIWQKTDEWRKGDKSWHFDLDRIVWGRKEYFSRVLSEVSRDIPMPEKSYAAEIKFTEATWAQPRKFWNRKRVMRRAHVKIPEGIPHPGKGTESYNCDDDALMRSTFICDNADDAVREVQKSVQWYRDNYPL